MYKRFAFVLAALALASCDSDKPVETVIYGTVLDAQTGQPLQGIPYQLYVALSGPGSFQSLNSGLTDANGRFTARTSFHASSQSGVDLQINADARVQNAYRTYRSGVRYGTSTLTIQLERKE